MGGTTIIRKTISLTLLVLLCSCYKSDFKEQHLEPDVDVALDLDQPDHGHDLPADTGFDEPPYTDVSIEDMGADDSAPADAVIDTVPFWRCSEIDADIVVPRDHATIQGAVDASSSGHLICVEPGVYHEHLQFNGKSIHVLGAAGPVHTIVDGDFSWTVVTISGESDPPLVIEGFTIRYGSNDGWDVPPGVAIFDASPVLSHVHIVDNIRNGGDGSGVVVSGNSAPTFSNVIIARNETHGGYGGGMLIEQRPRVTMNNVIVAGNMTYEGRGGGIQLETGASLNITNGIIAGNIIEMGEGGGINMDGDRSTVTLTNVTFTGNEARSGDGSALFIGYVRDGSSLTNVTITENHDEILAAVICIDCASVRFDHTNIWGNTPMDVYGLTNPVGTNGNISVDPGFLDTSSSHALDWDLHCASGSGLVDAGAEGILDPDGSPSDIGAYGGPGAASWDLDADGFPSWWQPGPYDHAVYPALGLDCNDLDPDIKPGSGC